MDLILLRIKLLRMNNAKNGILLLGLIVLLVFSCKSPLLVSDASYNVVKSGYLEREDFTEFILVFNKTKNDSIHVSKVIIYGYEGFDYHYNNIVLNDEGLSSTLKSTMNQISFSVYLNTIKATKKEVTNSQELIVEVFYDVSGENQKLAVKEFNNVGVKTLRN